MGRRKQDSLVEDIAELAARFHWGVGVALAILSYLVLHHFAGLPTVATVTPGEIGAMVTTTVFRSVSQIFQYLAPLPFLAGAFVSAIRRRRAGELHDQVAADGSDNALDKMTWFEFEGLVAETFRRKGYRVLEKGGDGPDGGVDLVVYMGSDKYLVQCKQWKTRQVGVAIVRELYGVMTAERAVGGFVVASGDFTPDAKAFAMGRSIELVDSRKLRRLVGGELPAAQASATAADPKCPKCGSAMVKRTAKSGTYAGNQFWGCTKFPSCKGIINLGGAKE